MIRSVFPLLLALTLNAQAATNPPLAALQIEIWPEYDRPGALVIYKAEFAPNVRLPAEVALRIPASSGGPSAVAYAADESGKLLNLAYQREDAGNFILVHIKPPQRFVHLEFYDRMATDKPQRAYRHAWPGDMAVERVSVLVKEPAASSNLAVQPKLDLAGQSPDGLNHRAAQLGALKAGEQLPIEIRYTKTDPRPSTEIIGAAGSAPSAQPSAPAASSEAAQPILPLALIAGGAVVLAGAIAALLWRRRRVAPSGGHFCPKCGQATQAGNRFCANCGAALH
jgi:hypothetical protein